MLSTGNISSGYSTAQAAKLLGVDTHEVTRLYRTGSIAGYKIAGNALLLDASSVQAYKNIACGAGRPWDAQTAWAALLLLAGANVDWLPYHRMRRLKQKLRTLSAEDLVWCARKRALAVRYTVSSSFADDLKSTLCLTGMSATTAADLGLVANSAVIDGYATNAKELIANFHLLEDVTGNCIIRTAFDMPSELMDSKEMPITIVAADLALSLDVRERRCGLDYLKRALDESCFCGWVDSSCC